MVGLYKDPQGDDIFKKSTHISNSIMGTNGGTSKNGECAEMPALKKRIKDLEDEMKQKDVSSVLYLGHGFGGGATMTHTRTCVRGWLSICEASYHIMNVWLITSEIAHVPIRVAQLPGSTVIMFAASAILNYCSQYWYSETCIKWPR